MAACEECWREASLQAFLWGGSTVDIYQSMMADPSRPCSKEQEGDE